MSADPASAVGVQDRTHPRQARTSRTRLLSRARRHPRCSGRSPRPGQRTPDAPALLGVSASLGEDIAHNVRLDSAPAVSVADLYTGVLYGALNLRSMDPATRRRANRWLVVISALYGALRLTDKIPPYRLSMSVNLDILGPLASVWRTPLAAVLPVAAGRGLIVDCRSNTYAAAWSPQEALATRWVQVRVPDATHMAKHTRGLVARYLCEAGVDARTAGALRRIVAQ
jgi:cytoplasmic iron level regulating protein YaaA (DUF328/UPF0246 family)